MFTLVEDVVLRKMMEMIGWEEGGDGIFNPGTIHYRSLMISLNRECNMCRVLSIIASKHLCVFLPGGSMTNMYALNLARCHHCPDIKEVGLSAAPRLVLFTSQEVGNNQT